MAITVQSVVNDVRDDIQDEDTDKRWSDADLVRYLNEAVLQIALVRPDATAKTSSVQLAAGTKQDIPADGLRFIKLTRNMGSNGSTPGDSIGIADYDVLTQFSRNWHSQAQQSSVRDYVFDEVNPTVYFVDPPVTASPQVWVELVYSYAPVAVTLSDNIPLEDVYIGPIKDWMRRCAYKKETFSAESQNLSVLNESSFYQSLGVKTSADASVSPNKRA